MGLRAVRGHPRRLHVRLSFEGLRLGAMAAVLLLMAVEARAQDLVQGADRAYESADLAAALSGYEAALAAGGLAPEALGHVALRLLMLRTATRDEAGARVAARVALAVDHQIAPSVDFSRAAIQILEDERRRAAPVSLQVDDVAQVEDGAPFMRVAVEAPIADCALRAGPVGAPAEPVVPVERGASLIRVALASAPLAPTPMQVELLDPWGNVLLATTVILRPAAVSSETPSIETTVPAADASSSAPEDPGARPVVRSRSDVGQWLLGIGGVTGGVGLLTFLPSFIASWVGFEALQSCMDPSCLQPHLDWTPALADVGGVLMGVGAAMLIVGWVLDVSEPAGSPREIVP